MNKTLKKDTENFEKVNAKVFGAKYIWLHPFLIYTSVVLLLSMLLSILFLFIHITELMGYRGYVGNAGFYWSSLYDMLGSTARFSDELDAVVYIKTFALTFLGVTLPSGFLSLFLTRIMNTWIQSKKYLFKTILILILNFVLCTLLFLLFLIPVFFGVLHGGPLPSYALAPETYEYYFRSIFTFKYHYDFVIASYHSLEASPSPFFFSSISTSVWLYLMMPREGYKRQKFSRD